MSSAKRGAEDHEIQPASCIDWHGRTWHNMHGKDVLLAKTKGFVFRERDEFHSRGVSSVAFRFVAPKRDLEAAVARGNCCPMELVSGVNGAGSFRCRGTGDRDIAALFYSLVEVIILLNPCDAAL